MIEKLECTCIEAYKTRKMRDPNCCACSCDYNNLVEQLAKANERVEMLLPITDTLYGLARNQLWIAYVWNDHNFKETPERYAREAAESLSILNVEEANKLFDAYQQLRKEQE